MPRFHQPDLTANPDNPFVRDGEDRLVRRSYWLDMNDRTLVMVMTQAVLISQTSKSRLEAENAALRFTARIWSLRFPKLVDRSLPELLD